MAKKLRGLPGEPAATPNMEMNAKSHADSETTSVT